jgi:NADPH:quinone reductase-like Zn-dependent oxidoreductase
VQLELFGIYEAGKIHPQVMRTFPMEEFGAALDLVATGQVVGKVVLTTSQPA